MNQILQMDECRFGAELEKAERSITGVGLCDRKRSQTLGPGPRGWPDPVPKPSKKYIVCMDVASMHEMGKDRRLRIQSAERHVHWLVQVMHATNLTQMLDRHLFRLLKGTGSKASNQG
ncbi:hypothetical protein SARC_00682 [Sphaeroforma arctica JP610]|uniref:Uncharacterized protein n=1 Tax=Sphaeroforma arctica JP610 TaxID=667725 RepID=A0A0L0GDW7_9EUKA|nr:hypothetical protein SARC_00682 [Sphaeroforma arctica JP610]KNC87205.1 hypothetical protein SARC_00682 [Sphaeroforma arctica JP610]|eukprot:XP_014161107.1 hypothetical protein SARC_00682 [Sphaeroforma arctica JP610]